MKLSFWVKHHLFRCEVFDFSTQCRCHSFHGCPSGKIGHGKKDISSSNHSHMLHVWSIYPHLPYISAKCKPNKQTCHWVIVLFFFDVKKQDVWTTSGILYLCTLCIIISSCGYLYNLRCEAMRWQHLKTAMKSQEDLYWSHMLHVLRGTFPVSLRRLVEFSPVAFVPYPWAAFGGGMVRIGAQKGTSSILC